jgi:hypothetical protein
LRSVTIWTVAEARAAGLDWEQLQSSQWRRIGPATYAASALGVNPVVSLEGALKRLPHGTAFSGLTAAWLHGLDVEPCKPIEATVPALSTVATRAAIKIRRTVLEAADIVIKKSLPCTSMVRTLVDVSQRLSLVEAVVVADMALHALRVDQAQLEERVAALAGRKGVKKFRRVVDLADRSESPMETRLRLLLVLAGLPRPEVQVDLHDEAGEHLARADLLYRAERLVIEYDGATHRDSIVEDDRRQNRLVRAGYRVLRFAAPDMASPRAIVSQVRQERKRRLT